MFYTYDDSTIALLNGKHTGRLRVELTTAPSGHDVEASLERTLIDVTVRPEYSGGVISVLNAFRLAKPRASIDKILVLLNKLDFIYPYRQSIGFYLERAGYSGLDTVLMARDQMQFDFYLAHSLQDVEFDPNWRVFFPKTLK